MVAHLTGYRNPYVTVELKPKFLQPQEYIWFPDESCTAFDGTEDEDPLAVQMSEVVMDGSSHPKVQCWFQYPIPSAQAYHVQALVHGDSQDDDRQ